MSSAPYPPPSCAASRSPSGTWAGNSTASGKSRRRCPPGSPWCSPTRTRSGCPTGAPGCSTTCSTGCRTWRRSGSSAPGPTWKRSCGAANWPLCSLENGLPLRDFHIVGISLLYELTFGNVLTILDLGGIPLLSRDRAVDAPLVVGGGPVASNPEPVADFFDLFVVGDGEEALPELVRREAALRPERSRFGTRAEYLRRFTDLPGVYAPASTRSAKREGGWSSTSGRPGGRGCPCRSSAAGCRTSSRWNCRADLLVPNTEIVHDRITAEISRGCMQGCRFCHAGVFYRPQRERDAGTLVRWIEETVARTGYEEVSLASLSSADFGGIESLAEGLIRRLRPGRVGLSFPSLRVSGLSERLAAAVAEIHKTGFTVAPEAGTQRMRDRINKNLGEDRDPGRDPGRLPLRLGPGEALLHDRPALRNRRGRRRDRLADRPDPGGDPGRAGLSQPPPEIPAQRQRLVLRAQGPHAVPVGGDGRPAELERKQGLLRRAMPRPGAHLKWHEPETSRLEGDFSRGDRRLAGVIAEAWRQGARFDGWNEWFRPDVWEAAFRHCGIEPDEYLRRSPIRRGAALGSPRHGGRRVLPDGGVGTGLPRRADPSVRPARPGGGPGGIGAAPLLRLRNRLRSRRHGLPPPAQPGAPAGPARNPRAPRRPTGRPRPAGSG